MREANAPTSVVAAVIRFNGNYIIGKRRAGQWAAGKWCFVGGKVKPGEALVDAVRREVLEEIGIYLQSVELHPFHQQTEEYENGAWALNYFRCVAFIDRAPTPRDCSAVAIVRASDIPTFDLLPVDIDIARAIALEATQ